MNIETTLIIVATSCVIIGVILSYWDDIGIWAFEFRHGKMSAQMAMDMATFHEDAAQNQHFLYGTKRDHERAAQAYEMYATRLIERAERKAKHQD